MVRCSGFEIAVVALIPIFLAVVQAGIVTNQSIGVSTSSSSSSNGTQVHAKSPRVGKVLYTAPYSNVRVSKHESLIMQGKPRSFGPGPVLVKSKKMEDEPVSLPVTSSTETTDPDTTTLTTEPNN